MFKFKPWFMLVVSVSLFSCGGGGNGGDNNPPPSISYKSYDLYAKNINGMTGFEIVMNIDKHAEYSLTKNDLLKDWEIKHSTIGNKIKIIAFNPNLKPLNKEKGYLGSLKLPTNSNIKSVLFKAVDDFGNKIEKASVVLIGK